MTAAADNVVDISPSEDTPKKKASVSAREAEAVDGFLTVHQCGVELKLPLKGKLPLSAIECFREGDNYGGLKEIIGVEQWKLLLEAGATDGDLDALSKQFNEASGN